MSVRRGRKSELDASARGRPGCAPRRAAAVLLERPATTFRTPSTFRAPSTKAPTLFASLRFIVFPRAAWCRAGRGPERWTSWSSSGALRSKRRHAGGHAAKRLWNTCRPSVLDTLIILCWTHFFCEPLRSSRRSVSRAARVRARRGRGGARRGRDLRGRAVQFVFLPWSRCLSLALPRSLSPGEQRGDQPVPCLDLPPRPPGARRVSARPHRSKGSNSRTAGARRGGRARRVRLVRGEGRGVSD